MKKMKLWIVNLTLAAAFTAISGKMHAQAEGPAPNFSGYAYEGTRVAATVSPNKVIGTIAIAAVITVLVAGNDSHHKHRGHSHSHSHSHSHAD